jgi:hypothetical protein
LNKIACRNTGQTRLRVRIVVAEVIVATIVTMVLVDLFRLVLLQQLLRQQPHQVLLRLMRQSHQHLSLPNVCQC